MRALLGLAVLFVGALGLAALVTGLHGQGLGARALIVLGAAALWCACWAADRAAPVGGR